MARRPRYRVWNGWAHQRNERVNGHGRSQVRAAIAAPSKAAALRAFADQGVRINRSEFTNYWAEGGGPDIIAATMSAPGVVFWQPRDLAAERGLIRWDQTWGVARPIVASRYGAGLDDDEIDAVDAVLSMALAGDLDLDAAGIDAGHVRSALAKLTRERS